MKNYSLIKSPSEVQLELASRFREIRRNKKVSQSQLANKSGVSLGSIKRFEQTGQISLESLLKLARLFDRLSDFETLFKIDTDLQEIAKLFS